MSETRDRAAPAGPPSLLPAILERYRLDPHGIHGVRHWGRVFENAMRLARATGAHPGVLEYFAILHDSCRRNDGWDPEHGPRAARLALDLRDRIDLEDALLGHLVEACECHTRGAPPGAPADVLTCLDADRLDIPRVGMAILPHLLHTDAARESEVRAWATTRALANRHPVVCRQRWGWR